MDNDPISWSDSHGLRPFYRKLMELRKEVFALRSRRIVFLPTNNPATLAFVRGRRGKSAVVVVLNFGRATDVRLSGRGLPRTAVAPDDLLSGAKVPIVRTRRSLTVFMQARSSVVLAER